MTEFSFPLVTSPFPRPIPLRTVEYKSRKGSGDGGGYDEVQENTLDKRGREGELGVE